METHMYMCKSEEHSSFLLAGLNKQRLKGQLCDVTVRVQGHHFKGHINVLATAMGYFRDLFGKSNITRNDDIIEIPAIVHSTGFAKVLDFVYTSQLCLSQSTVMQVLCSACYLQIPYVVEKCQEFIGTHGHVTLTGQPEAVIKKPSSRLLHTLSLTADLPLLSRLNQLSEKSRARMSLLSSTQQNPSIPPQKTTEPNERLACDLINTPPSPTDRSMGGNEEEKVTPEDTDVRWIAKDLETTTSKMGISFHKHQLPLHHENNADKATDKDKQLTLYSHRGRISQSYTGGAGKNTCMRRPTGKQLFQLGSRDQQTGVDHRSLAENFSIDQDERSIKTADSNNFDNDSSNQHPFKIEKVFDRNGVVINNTPNGLSIKSNLKRVLENNSFPLLTNKEKPKKEFGCDHCGKSFGRQQHLKRHILTHTGERPFPCEICNKRFRRSEHLKHHLNSHQHGMTMDGRKRTRKAFRTKDTYLMSQMALDRYNGHADESGSGIQADNEIFVSSPVILPSMFTDIEPAQKSPTEERNTAMDDTSHIDNHQVPMEGRQGSPLCGQQSPTMVLNLSSGIKQEAGESCYNQQRTPSPCDRTSHKSDNTGPDIKSEIPAEVTENSPRSASSLPIVYGNSSLFDENPLSSDLMEVERSEVLTTDLKRLIAAMDE